MLKNNTLLYIQNLSKTYHDLDGEVKALDHITFDLMDGEFLSIIGPSGCGKSTILSILCGMDKTYDGQITFKDNLKIGYMLQNDCLLEWKTIYENCLIGLKVQNNITDENKAYVRNLLEKYGLGDFLDKYPSSLSGGMRQRVALIRTLALKPDILLLDEPLSALDAKSRMEIGNDLYEIIKNEGKTAIMVTHDISEALSTSNRIILLSSRPGRIKNIYSFDFDGCNSPDERRLHEKFPLYLDIVRRDFSE